MNLPAQLDAFAPLMPGGRSRNTDPATSAEAAALSDRKIRKNAGIVLDEVRRKKGRTATEIANAISHRQPGGALYWRYEASRRLADLRRDGFVLNGEARRAGRRREMTWLLA